MNLLYLFMYHLMSVLVWVWYRDIDAVGVDHVPRKRPVLLCGYVCRDCDVGKKTCTPLNATQQEPPEHGHGPAADRHYRATQAPVPLLGYVRKLSLANPASNPTAEQR